MRNGPLYRFRHDRGLSVPADPGRCSAAQWLPICQANRDTLAVRVHWPRPTFHYFRRGGVEAEPTIHGIKIECSGQVVTVFPPLQLSQPNDSLSPLQRDGQRQGTGPEAVLPS